MEEEGMSEGQEVVEGTRWERGRSPKREGNHEDLGHPRSK